MLAVLRADETGIDEETSWEGQDAAELTLAVVRAARVHHLSGFRFGYPSGWLNV